MADLPYVKIYTDGSCEPNPGPGGWAALLLFGKHEREISGSEPDTTNNRMELTAAVQALKSLKEPYQVDLHTDSEYLKKGITEWLPGWKKLGWKRKQGKLANEDLWKALDSSIQGHQITWHWLRGHAGDRFNERVDRLAHNSIRSSNRKSS